jgi:hypothetical protein
MTDKKELTLDNIALQPPTVLDALPIAVLAHLNEQALQHAADASRMIAVLHGAFTRRYASGLNDTGTHHRSDGDCDITITVPKNVSWDAGQLAAAIAKLETEWGENPADYVETKITVAESKYKAWPPAIRDLFTPARTVKAGKPKFTIAAKEREAA